MKGMGEMGESYYSEFNINHETLYLELDRVKSENYHLKRQLSSKQNVNRGQSKLIASLEKDLKKINKPKHRYQKGRACLVNGFNE